MPDLSKYNAWGIIPGPLETSEEFFKRATYCQDLKNSIPKMLKEDLPFALEEIHSTEELMNEGCQQAKSLYDIYPSWVPLFFSNYQLSFWQGGCAWIFQRTEDSPTSAFFQLRKKFRTQSKYLGIYDRNELIAHELSHVGRMKFEEPIFEEILAYRTSNSFFRRFFGPIIKSSSESMLFMLSLLFLVFSDFLSLSNIEFLHFSTIARVLVLSLILFGVIRLCYRQRQFNLCFKKLKKILANNDLASSIIYRLTDQEIISFGKISTEEVKQYIIENQTLRWKVIKEVYLTHA